MQKTIQKMQGISKEKLLFLLIFSITILICLSQFSPKANAGAFNYFTTGIKNMEDTINNGVSDSIEKALSSDSAVYKAIITDNSIVGPVYNVLAGIAAGIAVIGVAAHAIHEVSMGQDKVECFMRGLIKGITVCLVVLLLPRILMTLENLGSAVYTELVGAMKVDGNAENPSLYSASMWNEKRGLFPSIERWAQTVFPWMLAWISKIVAQVLSYSVLIELTIRKMFSPWAVANISFEGPRAPGMRWFQRYFAVYLRMAMIYALSYVGRALMVVLCNNVTGAELLLGVIVVNFTIVAMMLKSGELANEAVGT